MLETKQLLSEVLTEYISTLLQVLLNSRLLTRLLTRLRLLSPKSADIANGHSCTREATYKDPQKPSIGFLDPSTLQHFPMNCKGWARPILEYFLKSTCMLETI